MLPPDAGLAAEGALSPNSAEPLVPSTRSWHSCAVCHSATAIGSLPPGRSPCAVCHSVTAIGSLRLARCRTGLSHRPRSGPGDRWRGAGPHAPRPLCPGHRHPRSVRRGRTAGRKWTPRLPPQHLHAIHRGHALGGPAPPQLRAQHPHHDQRHRGHDHLPGCALQVPLLQGEPGPARRPPARPALPLMQQPLALKKSQSSFFLQSGL